jgi:phosphoglycolate phosphatase
VSAVLFDKDGTLSHSEPRLTLQAESRIALCLESVRDPVREQLRALLEKAYGIHRGQLHPAGMIAVASRQHNLISTATALCQVGLGWPDALATSEAVFSEADRLGNASGAMPAIAPLTEGLAGLLEALERAGVTLGVISNDTTAGIEAFLEAHGLSGLFEGVWSADDRPAKPDPAAVHRFCGQLGVAHQQCALIGDADSDLRMALSAGVPLALGYTAGWHHRPVLLHGHALIDHWSELRVVAGP